MSNNDLQELVAVFNKIGSNKPVLTEFIKDLLTPAELEEIPTRWQIIKQLDQKIPQHEIARRLKVGIGTVTRGASELKNKSGGFQLALNLTKKK